MVKTILIGDNGQPIECWEPAPGMFLATSTWTREETQRYAETGEYPQRLLNQIRDRRYP